MITKKTLFLIQLVCVVLAVPPEVSGDQPLSDDAKKAVVYEMYRGYKGESFPNVLDIPPRRAMSLVPSGTIVFVDTREAEEMDVSMLPDAITRAAFLKNVERYREKTIVAYCTISYRSGKFAEEMAARGVTIYNLEGGILAWVLEGGTVCDKEGESKRIHVYGGEWDYAPAGYETVKFSFFERLF
jgi:sodium/bile acid cotransporter 7